MSLSLWNQENLPKELNLDEHGYPFNGNILIHRALRLALEKEDDARKQLLTLGWNGRGRLAVAHLDDCKQNPNVENTLWIPQSLNVLCQKVQDAFQLPTGKFRSSVKSTLKMGN